MFQMADPTAKDRNGKVIGRLAACVMCELLPTKPSAANMMRDQILDRVERLVAEGKAGFPVDLSDMTPLEADLVVYWRRYEEMRERAERSALLRAILNPRM